MKPLKASVLHFFFVLVVCFFCFAFLKPMLLAYCRNGNISLQKVQLQKSEKFSIYSPTV